MVMFTPQSRIAKLTSPGPDLEGLGKAVGSAIETRATKSRLAELGSQVAQGDLKGASATALQAGDINTGLAIQDRDRANQEREIDRLANAALIVENEPNPEKRTKLWERVVTRIPNANNLTPEELDPVSGPSLLIAEAGRAKELIASRLQQRQVTAAESTAGLDRRLKEARITRLGAQTDLDKAKASGKVSNSLVTVNTGDARGQTAIEAQGNKKFSEEAAKRDASRFSNLIDNGRKAQERASDLNLLDEFVVGANTNKLADFRTAFQGVADAFGVDTSNFGSLQDAEAIQAIVSKIAPSLRQPGSGPMSDRDLEVFMRSIPGLTTSVPGNKLIISTMRAFGARAQEEAAIAQQAFSGDITRKEANRRLNALGLAISPKMARVMRFLATKSASLGDGNFAFTPETGDLWRKGKDSKWRKFEPK